MGKKQKAKAIKKVTVKKAAIKKVAAKVTAKKPVAKQIGKSVAKTKPALKKMGKPLKTVKAAPVKAVKASPVNVVKSVPVKKVVTALKSTSVSKQTNALVKSTVAGKQIKQVGKVGTTTILADKKAVKKIIVPAKKRDLHPNQYTIEYPIHASASLLFEIISSPSGLSEWFADNVNIRDGNFTFFWDGSQQTAKMVAYKEEKMVRFRWTDKPEYTFFEFKIETDELTNDTSLIITDFAEDGDKESAKLLWDNQINGLKHAIGS